MSEAIACLVRVGDNVRKNRLIKLDREQVTVGRSGDVNYTILSTMISRCHAIFKQQDGKWSITDNKSLNGVFVNGRQLTAFKAYIMEDGDMVQFGVSTSPDTPAEFLYKYHASLKVRIKRDGIKRMREGQANSEDTKHPGQSAGSQNESDSDEPRKRKVPVPSSSRLSGNSENVLNEDGPKTSSKEAEYQAKLAHMERLLQEKDLKQSEVEKQLEKEKQEREKRMKEVEELRLKEQAILIEMQDKQAKLEKEKEELKQQMQAELEANLKEKEQALVSQLADQKQSLLDEKKRIEESLQAEMAKALEMKSKEVEDRLISMKENLEKVIEKKDNEQKILETTLNQTRVENESAKLQALKAREDVLSNFVDLMEMELQCTICNELFIKATALNCAHVFCKLCISQWMKVKMECPNCRMTITSHMQAIALDSYIEKMVEQFTDDLKASRKALLEQRKVDQDKFDAGPSTNVQVPGMLPVAAAPRGRGGNRRRGRSARGRNARGRGASNTNVPGVYTTTAMTAQSIALTRTNPQIMTVAAPQSVGLTIMNPPIMTAPQSIANPRLMTVTTPPVLATTTMALRSLLATPQRSTAISTVGATQTNASSDPETATSSTALIVNDALTTSNTTPIVLNDSTSSVTPIVVSGAESLSDEEELDEDEELLYGRYYGRRRRYWLDSDTEEEESSTRSVNDDDDGSSVEGNPAEYYGGYGRCFKCGSRGHWANGCPF